MMCGPANPPVKPARRTTLSGQGFAPLTKILHFGAFTDHAGISEADLYPACEPFFSKEQGYEYSDYQNWLARAMELFAEDGNAYQQQVLRAGIEQHGD